MAHSIGNLSPKAARAAAGLTASEVSRVVEMAWEAKFISPLAQTCHRTQNKTSAITLSRRQPRLLSHSIQTWIEGTYQ